MSKVITFSRYFPAYHPRKGEPTYFVEQLINGFVELGIDVEKHLKQPVIHNELCGTKKIKWHTIRAGHRFKKGDKFSPRLWTGKPYNSKQAIIAPDIEVANVFDFDITTNGKASCIFINSSPLRDGWLPQIAQNDGLSIKDMRSWFKDWSLFKGQIICWNPEIQY